MENFPDNGVVMGWWTTSYVVGGIVSVIKGYRN